MHEVAKLAEKALSVTEQKCTQPSSISPTIRKLFLVLHGHYGNLFLSKFATGELGEDGKDKGIKSAMRVWEAALGRFSCETIVSAAQKSAEKHLDYPPSLPQFLSICRALEPVEPYQAGPPMLELPPPDSLTLAPIVFEKKNDGRDWARLVIAKKEAGHHVGYAPLEFAKQALYGRCLWEDEA